MPETPSQKLGQALIDAKPGSLKRADCEALVLAAREEMARLERLKVLDRLAYEVRLMVRATSLGSQKQISEIAALLNRMGET